jgi:hypothetical protein
MNRLLLVTTLIVVGIAGVGIYRGWFSTETSTSEHKSNVNLSVDREKIQDDLHAVKEKAEHVFEKKETVTAPSPPKN